MASGYTPEVTNGSFSVRFHWTSSYDAGTNRSTVSVTPQVYNTGNYGGDLRACGYNLSNAGIYLNGTRSYAFDATWGTANNLVCAANLNTWTNFPPYSGSIGTVTVAHDANGVATATVRFLGTVVPLNATSYRKGIDTGNQTITITENAASSIESASSSAATLGRFSLTMSRKASTNYHIATFRANGQTTLYTSDRFDTSLDITVPRSWFANYPALTSLPVTVSVQTYNSGGTAVGGALTHSLTVTADADMKPVPSSGWVSLAPYNTGAVQNITGYVKGYSRAQASFDASKVNMSSAVGASVASFSVTCQGESDGSSPYLTPVLASASVNVVCTVTDTRGRSASQTLTISVMDYAAPAISAASVFRCNSEMAADENGTYLSVRASRTFSSLNGQNACTLTAAYAASGDSYGTAAALTSGTAMRFGPVSADISYTVRFTATDSLGNSAVFYATVSTRKWAMKFRIDGNGVAFGKAAEYNKTLEIAPDWTLRVHGQDTERRYLPTFGTQDNCLRNCYGLGQNWYFKIATLTVSGAYSNQTVTFTISQRGYQTSVLQLMFANGNTTDPDVQWFQTDAATPYYYRKIGAGKWEIIGKYSELYGFALLHSIVNNTAGRVAVDIAMTNLGTTAPSGMTQVTKRPFDIASVIPVANGGTGGNTAAAARRNLGVGKDLLWTNPHPTADFGAQTLSLSIPASLYRSVTVEFLPFGETNTRACTECPVGAGGALFYAFLNTDTTGSGIAFINAVSRSFSVSNTGIVFQNGQMLYNGSVYTNWANRAIPFKVFANAWSQ